MPEQDRPPQLTTLENVALLKLAAEIAVAGDVDAQPEPVEVKKLPEVPVEVSPVPPLEYSNVPPKTTFPEAGVLGVNPVEPPETVVTAPPPPPENVKVP